MTLKKMDFDFFGTESAWMNRQCIITTYCKKQSVKTNKKKQLTLYSS